MCGIAGLLDLKGHPLPSDGLVEEMARRLVHRGPDGEGCYAEGPAAMRLRRLAVIDLLAPPGPYGDESGQIVAAVNGEIYNYPELAGELRSRGHTLRTNCDTEVVAHLYEEHGADMVSRLDGMFALSVWDARNRRLLLARDRAGEKPLYYALCGEKLLFASELQALLASPDLPREIDAAALPLYLLHDHYPSPATPLRQIRKLPAAHRLVADRGGIRIERYWSLASSWEAPPWKESQTLLQERLLGLLQESVRRRWRSDVPAGVLLSGGIDSSTILALVCRTGTSGPRTFTLGFLDPDFNEAEAASRTAFHFGAEHQQQAVGFCDLAEALEELAPKMADPLADPSLLPAWLISRFARRTVTVALSGEGSDEIFGGYPTYPGHRIAARLAGLPAPARRLLASAVSRIPVTHGNHSARDLARQLVEGMQLDLIARHMSWFGSTPPLAQERLVTEEFRRAAGEWDPYSAVQASVNGISFRDDLCRIMHIDLSTYLQDGLLTKMDRASMLHSLEVRTPFLDHHLIEFAARLPTELKVRGAGTKILLRRATSRLLPRNVLHRRKRGFAIPLARWIDHERGDFLEAHLGEKRLREQGIFEPAAVRSLLRQHIDRRADNRRKLWNLLMFQLWYRHYIEEPVAAARPARGQAAITVG